MVAVLHSRLARCMAATCQSYRLKAHMKLQPIEKGSLRSNAAVVAVHTLVLSALLAKIPSRQVRRLQNEDEATLANELLASANAR